MRRLPLLHIIAVLCCCHAYEYEVEIVDPAKLSPGSRIIGGSATTIQNYPYTVQVAQNRQLICGGTLVTRRHVLSAAHCFITNNGIVASAQHFLIRAGSSTLNSGGQTRRVSMIIVHEAYSRVTQDADVALLVLSAAVTAPAQPAAIPAPSAALPDNATLVHVGWGHTSVGGQLSQVLQEVQVRKVNRIECSQRYAMLMAATGHVFVVTPNMICAGILGTGGADACQGDSGGPLVSWYNRSVVVGVTSWGYGCGDAEFPGVSARVSNFTDWIRATVQRYNGAPSLSLANAVVLLASLLASLSIFKDV